MRPVKDQHSTLKTPLNDILGYQANVRLLRSLVEAREVAMSHSELADRTGLSLPGVHKVVSRLIETGIIQFAGSGKQQQVELRAEHPLAEAVVGLFEAEKAYFDSLIRTLKGHIQAMESKPMAVWIFGDVAQGNDEYGDPLRIALLGNATSVDSQADALRDRLRLSGFEADFDVTIDVQGVTQADLEFIPEPTKGELIGLWGPHPKSFLESKNEEPSKGKTHQELDKQSLADAKHWSTLLAKYPEIIPRTIDHLKDRIPRTASGEKRELQEWKHILESMSLQRLKKFLESDSERSTRLRQSLPFWPVLNNSERATLKKMKSEQTEVHG